MAGGTMTIFARESREAAAPIAWLSRRTLLLGALGAGLLLALLPQLLAVATGSGGGVATTAALASVFAFLASLLPEREDAAPAQEEAALRASVERLQILLRNSPDLVFVCDGDGFIRDANDAALSACGRALEDLRGRNISSLIHAGNDAAPSAPRGALPSTGPHVCRRADGSELSLDLRTRSVDLSGESMLLVSGRDASERRRLEVQAKAQQARLAVIVDHLPACAWSTDTSLRVKSAGGRGLGLLGMIPSDIVGFGVEDALARIGGPLDMLDFHEQALEKGSVALRYEFRGRVLEGLIARVESDDFPAELLGIALDVTERERAERERRAFELRLREILDNAPIMVFIKDLDLRITYINGEMARVSGIPREKAIGMNAAQLLPPHIAAKVEANDRQAVLRGRALTVTEELGRGAARRCFASVRFPLQDSEGRATAICSFSREITDRVRLDEELRHRAELLHEAQSLASLGSWEWRLPTGEYFWSEHMFALLGLDPAIGAEAGVLSYFRSLPENERRELLRRANESLASESAYRFEHQIRHQDGSMRWLLVQGHLDRDESGKVVRVYGFAQDTTAEREAADAIARLHASLEDRVAERTAELEYAKKELSAFSFAVSHDLREPLRAIAGYLGLMEDEVGRSLSPLVRQHLDRIQQAARRMDATIDALLSLSNLTRVRLRRITLDASEMAREIASELDVSDPGRRVRWQIEDGITVNADRGLFRAVLQNLLANAFKFTRGREDASIAFGREDGALFVRDNGAGFDSSSASRLFQPFQRMHDERDFEGTGVGLATVARILERHEGSIEADSAVGKGATFRFRLP